MTNFQLSVLCGTFLAGAVIVAGSNVLLVRSASLAAVPAGRPVVAMMPGLKGDAYFASCREGAEEAARELGIELLWDGPTGRDSALQIQMVDSWITRHVDAIAVAPSEQSDISPVLRKARAHGIRVVTWDSDAQPDARDIFVNAAPPDETGRMLADETERLLPANGEVMVLGGAARQWPEMIRRRLAARHSTLKFAAVGIARDDPDQAFEQTRAYLRTHPELRLVAALSPFAVHGAAEAVVQSGHPEVKVIGVGQLSSCRRYLEDGPVQSLVHWNTRDLGYLAFYTAALLAQGRLESEAASFPAGRLGRRELCGGEVVLNPPQVERAAVPMAIR